MKILPIHPILRVALLLSLPFVPASAQEKRQVVVSLETAPAATGPWTFLPADDATVSPDGRLVASAPFTNGFIRVQMERPDRDAAHPHLPLADVPVDAVDRARRLLADLLLPAEDGELDEEAAAWDGAELGPNVLPFFDPTFDGGNSPAAYEFKVIGPEAPSGTIGFLAGPPAAPAGRERGFILVSMDEFDAPVPSFGMRGPTPGELLLRLSRSHRGGKLWRFGPAFLTLEDPAGNLLAHLGTQPFKLPASLLAQRGTTFSGEFDSDRDVAEPPDRWGGDRVVPEEYRSYEEFKADYVTNPVLQALRENRRMRNRADWEIERGGVPPAPEVIDVPVGDSLRVLEGVDIPRFFVDEDNLAEPVASVTQSRTEPGLLVSGLRAGEVVLTALCDGSVRTFAVRVTPRTAPGPILLGSSFVPGWQAPKFWSAGSYGSTPRYYQWESAQWCPVVGCGPVAWAMLLGWWDNRGVPSAFYASTPYNTLNQSMRNADAPLDGYPGTAAGRSLLRVKFNELHDACDVMCVGNNGATPPGDMVEALAPVTYIARGAAGAATPDQLRYLGMSYNWSWDLMDPDWNQPSNFVRASILDQRPAVLGLGWLWHYVLAYKYRLQEYRVTEGGPVMYRRRWFGVNEGWGKETGAYYSGGDTFLGTNLRLWQRHLPAP